MVAGLLIVKSTPLWLSTKNIMKTFFIYPNDEGGVVLGIPAPNCNIPLSEIARKDVPPGKPFKFVTEAEVPQDHTFFAAFEADFSNPDGFGIGPDAWHAEQAQRGNA